MKKLFVIILVFVLTIVLASCNSQTDTNTNIDDKDASKNIVFYHTLSDSLFKVVNDAIEEFQDNNPGWSIEVKYISYEDDFAKQYSLDSVNNTLPDMVLTNSNYITRYLDTKKVLDLNYFINSDNGYSSAEIDDFISPLYLDGISTNFSNAKENGYSDDALLAIPFYASTSLMYVNLDALEELGVGIPRTWEQLWDLCILAKQKWPNSIPFCCDGEYKWFSSMCKQNGWEFLSTEQPYYLFNNGDTINWLKEINNYYSQGLLGTLGTLGAYTNGLLNIGPDGGSILYIGSSSSAPFFTTSKFNLGIAPIPGAINDEGSFDASSLAINTSFVMFESNASNKSEKEMMTWKFIKSLLEPEIQAKFIVRHAHSSVRNSTYDTEIFEESLKDKNKNY